MGRIFYLMGKSSTGKDTIYKKLLESNELILRTILPYTTRPIRAGESNGVEYIFSNEEELQKLEAEGRVIELRSYDTFHGIWKYFTVDDGQIDLEKNDYLLIGTLESYNRVRAYYQKENVIPVLIELDDGIRLQRALDREKVQDSPKYQEMCRRYLADSEDFSEENIRQAEITRRFYNHDLDTCMREIIAYMQEEV